MATAILDAPASASGMGFIRALSIVVGFLAAGLAGMLTVLYVLPALNF